MSSYNYSISLDTSNALLNSSKLETSIQASSISQVLSGISTNGDSMIIKFGTSLTAEEQGTLNALVASHDGTPDAELPEIEIDKDGRQIQRSAATYKGWRYLAHPIELCTSTAGGLYTKDWQGNDRSNAVIKFYNESGEEIVSGNQSDLDANCTKTEVTIYPNHDYDLIGGNVHQQTTPSDNIRLWVIAGAVDIKHLPGTVTEFVGGLNLKFINPGDHIETDGRASARLNLNTDGVPTPTNKMQYIFKHPVGYKHDIMIVVEYFRK